MHSTANDATPQFKVEEFPTIHFAPLGKKKEPLRFDSDRILDGFTGYLEEHSTVSQKKPKKDEPKILNRTFNILRSLT